MTINQYTKKYGWSQECDLSKPHRFQTIDVSFENEEALNGLDETEFDIPSYNVKELATLFKEFCKENGVKANSVRNIRIVAAASTLNELP